MTPPGPGGPSYARRMATIFSRIIDGELPGPFVWRDEVCVAFLSIGPLRPGHVLVVPRVEVDHWLDLDPSVAEHLMRVSQVIGQAQMAAFEPERVGLVIAGMEVPHTHLHLIPIRTEADLSFANAGSAGPEELEANAARLRAALVDLGRPEVADR